MGLAERAEIWASSQDSVDSVQPKESGLLDLENKEFIGLNWEACRSPEIYVWTVVAQCLGIPPLPWTVHMPPGPRTASHNKMACWRCRSERPGEEVGHLPSREYEAEAR